MARTDFTLLRKRLERLGADALSDRLMGLEKESLRVTPEGRLAQTPHPRALGSALTHPWITTDYSEALIELVTPPLHDSWEVMQFLVDVHQFVRERMGGEMLWASSMPCSVSRDEDVPIAWFGTSNVGMMKHVYRRGLGHRYGRLMQAISGVHFNYSVGHRFWQQLLGDQTPDQDEISARYFGLLRNFRRYGWLLLYLFGASPALCRGFVGDAETDLEEFESTLFGEYATSLRMSDLGYKNKVQSRLEIPVNDISEYIARLTAATDTPYPAYEELGVVVDGEYRQLNANILQIENEYYSLIRPKRVARSGEKPTHALRRGGVEYVEVRACDVSPFDPVGVNQVQLRFIEVLLLFCLLHDSAKIDPDEQARIDQNLLEVARRGRDPALRLKRAHGDFSLQDCALELAEQLLLVAEFCDRTNDGDDYSSAVAMQIEAIRNPDLTPSARVLRDMRDGELSFFEFALHNSQRFDDYFASLVEPSEARRNQLLSLVEDSVLKQQQIEDSDELSFDDFLARYFSQS